MNDSVDQEIAAIKAVLEALSPISPKARLSVLEYAVKRLELNLPELSRREVKREADAGASGGDRVEESTGKREFIHIKQFKEQKKPRSANEMAALVAYYLANLAPEGERKKTLTQKDVETFFKIAEFPLPNQIRMTLANAKAAGYLDTSGEGEYKLNAVGHNLVVHSMPRGAQAGVRKSRTRKPTKRHARKQK